MANLITTTTADEKNVKRLFLNAPALIAVLKGREGRCEFFNTMFSKLWGGRDVTGKPMREAWPELEGQGWFEIVEEVYDTSRSIHGFEKPAVADWDNDGQAKELFFNFVYSPSIDDHGNTDGVIIFGFDVTQQVNTRKKIEESESYFRRLADTIPAILWVTQPDGSCNYLNQSWYDTTGQTQEQALGFGWLDAIHPEDRAAAGKIFMEANAGQVPFNLLYRLRQKNGNFKWAVDSGSPRYDKNGVYEGYIGCVTDVHDQILTEGRYERMFEGAPVSIFLEDFSVIKKEIDLLTQKGVTDLTSYFASQPRQLNDLIQNIAVKSVNRAAVSLLEADTKEELAKRLSSIFVQDTSDAFIKELELIRTGGGPFRYETVLQTLRGRRIEVLVHIDFPQSDDYSNVLVTLIDVSVTKKAESALRLSEERFRILANAIPQVVWTAAPDGRMEYLSSQWQAITGSQIEDALKTGFQPYIHPDDFTTIVDKWKNSLESERSWIAEYRLKNISTNSFRWFQGHTIPLKDETGKLLKWIGAATDIQSLKEYSQTLEKEVAQRTYDLQQSNESLQQFAHVASHDLKEPVRKIRIFVDRLRRESENLLPNSSKLYLDKIERAADRMMIMVEGVLNYSTVDARTQEKENVDLKGLVSNIESDLELLIGDKKAMIVYGDLPTIEGAPILIFQLFYNLINNSLKFKQANRDLKIEITSRLVSEGDKTYAEVLVRDNGIGFDNQYAEKIFDTFTRLHTKDQYEGTGLGLSLCKKIVLRHHGKIWAEGKPNVGAEFHIQLPLRQA